MARIPPRTIEPNAGVYLGTITRVTGATCYLELPRLAKGFEYGPAPYPDTYKALDGPASSGTAGAHTHQVNVDAVGSHAHSYTDDGVGSSTGTAGGHTHAASTDSTGGHAHSVPAPVAPLAKGDRVAVAFLEGGRDDVVVLARLA